MEWDKPDVLRSYKRDVVRPLDEYTKHIERYQPVTVGNVGGYPILYLHLGWGDKHILVSGGVHGDEPAGTIAALDLIKFLYAFEFRGSRSFMNDFQFHIFPCVNPWGYEHNKRKNADGVDINRDFEKFEAEESRIIADHLEKLGHEFVFAMDMHEGSPNEKWKEFELSDNPRGVWLYESCHDHSLRVGRRMIDALKADGFDVCDFDTIYHDINSDGVVWYPEGMKSDDYAAGNSLDAYMWKNHTPQSFTSETCTTWSMEDRIRAQHVLVLAAMEGVLGRDHE